MERRDVYLRRVHARYPDLTITAARLDTQGQNNVALIVNDAIIFRFPRYADAIAPLRTEAAILRALPPALPLPVPDPTYAWLDTDAPDEAFIGYRMLPGAPLWPDVLTAIDAASIATIAAQLAAFLRALHAVPTTALPADLPIADEARVWAEMYARIQLNLFSQMRPDARAWVTEHFTTFLNDPQNHAWTPVLRHGDFGPSNILFDPATRAVTGIIDFDSAALGDPAVDVAALASYGQEFGVAFHAAYPEMAAVAHRVAFYAGTFALQEALFGAEHDDPEAFASGIAPYQ